MLEIDPGADADTIKKAYRRLARRWHPDVNSAPEAEARFKELASAFEILSDPVRRRAHDAAAGRVSRGELPEAFLDDVRSAIERAQVYAERVVVPHYAGIWRGRGTEMAARLWHDLEQLADPTWLQTSPGWRARRRAARWVSTIHVTMETWPAGTLSTVHRVRGGGWAIQLTPWALHRAGFTRAADIDDALLRVLLARYAQVLTAGSFVPPAEPDDWPAALLAARTRDTRAIAATWGQRAVYATIAGLIGLMLYAGATGW